MGAGAVADSLLPTYRTLFSYWAAPFSLDVAVCDWSIWSRVYRIWSMSLGGLLFTEGTKRERVDLEDKGGGGDGGRGGKVSCVWDVIHERRTKIKNMSRGFPRRKNIPSVSFPEKTCGK